MEAGRQPRLARQGDEVTCAGFEGGHEVPERIQRRTAVGLGWAPAHGAQPAA